MKPVYPVLALIALTAAACGGGGSPAPTKPAPAPATAPAPAVTPAAAPAATQTAPSTTPAAPTAADRAEADQIFAMRCTPCHGASGHGDGAAAAALNPKPRNYSDKTWQAKTQDSEIAKAIVSGGPSVGLSALMPPNPDLAAKPAVVQALVDKIRSFGK